MLDRRPQQDLEVEADCVTSHSTSMAEFDDRKASKSEKMRGCSGRAVPSRLAYLIETSIYINTNITRTRTGNN